MSATVQTSSERFLVSFRELRLFALVASRQIRSGIWNIVENSDNDLYDNKFVNWVNSDLEVTTVN